MDVDALRNILNMVEAEQLVYRLPDRLAEVGVHTQAERLEEKKVETLADQLA